MYRGVNMKKIFISSCCIFIVASLFSFEWPQKNITTDEYNSYFGQYIGTSISSSFIFANPSEIYASENGAVLIVMTEQNDDSVFFPSTLGNSVILSHSDNLLSVYGNMEKSTVQESSKNREAYISGEKIGESGNSGWQQNKNGLEFQIIDTKNTSAINPNLLMVKNNSEIDLLLNDIYLENKDNEIFDLKNKKTISSGLYRVYKKRDPIAIPYKTTVLINGVIVDQISYDTISQENNKIYIVGKKKYLGNVVYPNDTMQLVGETMFTSGKVTLSIIVNDIFDKSKQIDYKISIN